MHIITKTRHKLPGGGGEVVFSGTVFLGGYFATEVCDDDIPNAYRGSKPNKMPQ